MSNVEQKAIQALNLLKGIADDAQIKKIEHELASQSVGIIYDALQELHQIKKNNKIEKNNDKFIFTNMQEEELEVVFLSGKQKIPHSGYPRCCLIKSVTQSIALGPEWTDIRWDSVDYDNSEMHSIVLNHARATIHKKGLYVFHYKIRIQTNDKITSLARLIKNGNIVIPRSGTTVTGSKDSSIITIEAQTPMIDMDIDDYIVLQSNHDDKSVKNIFPNDSFLSCERRY